MDFHNPALILSKMAGALTKSFSLSLETPLAQLRGVGPERSAQFERLGLRTVNDLLDHRPRRYEDRRSFLPIKSLQLGEWSTVRGTISVVGIKTWRHGARSVVEFVLEDGSARLHCRWWNLPYMLNYFQKGDEVLVYGKVRDLKPRTMDHPETEVVTPGEENFIHLNRIVPIYPLTEGLSQRWLRAFIWRRWAECKDQIPEPWPPELWPGLPSRREALQKLHFPETAQDPKLARERLAADEVVVLQLTLQRRRRNLQQCAPRRPCRGNNRLVKQFLQAAGLAPSESQKKVLREIRADLSGGLPMRRLLQGEVGSGKTFVAAAAALMVLESGFNVALMAPTEILARQHYQTFRRWLGLAGVQVALRTGEEREGAEDGALQLVVGTHALLSEKQPLPNLGLVVIDEQHKFGVAQREQLLRKGDHPHLLVLSATPIPRTLGLTLYGDLDLSVLDRLPDRRAPVRTFIRNSDDLPKIFAFVRERLDEGRQAYVVLPRIEEGLGELRALRQETAKIAKLIAPFDLGAVHGKMTAAEKEEIVSQFRQNKIGVLLGTTMVEVGLDVPNASVMLVENAEQFGLAQLHQLRGRVGRGPYPSYCILIHRGGSEEARERLEVLARTNDGFQIAEEDLRLRGAGDFLGADQSGLPPFRYADLAKDYALIERARAVAAALVGSSRRKETLTEETIL